VIQQGLFQGAGGAFAPPSTPGLTCPSPYKLAFPLFNCRRMYLKATVVVCSVCLSITTKSAAYLVYTSKIRCHRVLYQWCFQGFCHVAFAENASLKSSGVVCWLPLPSSLSTCSPRQIWDGNGFFSTRNVCMVSDRSNK
jgi:hypothetical protein